MIFLTKKSYHRIAFSKRRIPNYSTKKQLGSIKSTFFTFFTFSLLQETAYCPEGFNKSAGIVLVGKTTGPRSTPALTGLSRTNVCRAYAAPFFTPSAV